MIYLKQIIGNCFCYHKLKHLLYNFTKLFNEIAKQKNVMFLFPIKLSTQFFFASYKIWLTFVYKVQLHKVQKSSQTAFQKVFQEEWKKNIAEEY